MLYSSYTAIHYATWSTCIMNICYVCMHKTLSCVLFLKKQLTKIWNGKPCHVVKARIGRNAVHHGSFHSLKPNQDVNDEVH